MFKSKIFDKLFLKFGYVNKLDIKKFIVPVSETMPESIVSEKTYAQLVSAYKSWVYTCIDKISKSVAKMPLKLFIYRNSTGQKVNLGYQIKEQLREMPKELQKNWLIKQNLTKYVLEEHPFLNVIKKPNTIMTRYMLWYETMTRLELGGIVGWYLIKDGLGVPREIWPLPLTNSGTLQPKVETDLTVSYWLYRDCEINQKFDPTEILVFKYPNPKSPFSWFSPLMAQMYPYDIDFYLQQQQTNFYKNGLLPSLIAETDTELDKDQVNEILNQITEKYAEPTRAGKVMLFHSGLKQGAHITPKDALLDKVSQFAREKIISAYDLSEGKLGLVKDVNRANMQVLDKTYNEDCLIPRTMMIEEVIETFFLPQYDKGLMLDFVLPDNTDKEFELQKADMELKNYAIAINEYRNRIGMEPVAWGDVPWGPMGVMPLMSGSSLREPEPKEEEKKSLMTKSMEPLSQWNREKKKIAWLEKYNQRLKWMRAFEANMNAFFKAQQTRVLENFDKYAEEAFEAFKDIDDWWVHMAQTKAIKPDKIGLDKKKEVSLLEKFFDKFYFKMLENSGNTVLQKLGLTVSYQIDKTAEKYLSSRLRMFSKETTGTTFDHIQKILTDGYDQGLPYLEIKTNLKNNFDKYQKYRAQLIARTECNSAMGRAEKLALKQQGIDKYLKKHWLTDQGPERRETHIEAEQRYTEGIPINQDFIVGDDRMDMPGNGSLAKENINCVCTVIYSRDKIPL